MINLTDSLSACTASGILAYAKQIYHQMSGGTATNVEDLLNEHEAKIDRKAELSDKGSLVLGNTNYATNKESIVGGTGVYQRGARGFGFGYTMFALYLTGDGETNNYTARLNSYNDMNIVADVLKDTHIGSYLLSPTDLSRVAQITAISWSGTNQPFNITLDTNLGALNNQVYAMENVGSACTFSVGAYGNIGQYSVAMGYGVYNKGKYSHIFGYHVTNTANYANIFGYYNKNNGFGGTMFGYGNTNSGQFSTTGGVQNKNLGNYATVLGTNNNNKAQHSQIIGYGNIVNETNYPSNILGSDNKVSANTQTFTVGFNNVAAKGQYTQNSGATCTFMFGQNLKSSRGSVTLGWYNKDYDVENQDQQNAFVFGHGTPERPSNTFELKANGDLYIYQVGGFNGTNSTETTTKSLQAKIAELENAKALLNELNTKMDVLMDDMDVEAKFAYGVQWDKAATSPDCTRVGNMLLHAMLPVQSQMRGCLLNDNGEVVKYLAESGWTEETLDGSMGQVMVEIPEFYWKFTESGNTQTVMLSQVPIEGYAKVSKRYVSAYEATIDNNGNTGTTNSSQYKLASVKNTTARYRGCNNVASNDETYKSGLGMPRTNLSLQTFRESARRRKPSTYEWNCYDYMTHKILYWLFVVEFATRHTQKAVDSTTTISGYKTGGLGNGVTTVNSTEWTNLYGNYPIVPCGTSDSLGNGTGEVSYAVPSSGAGETWTTVKVPRYRGIENPFGHIWKQTDGIKVEVEPGGTTSGESKVYVCYTPSNYNSTSDVANYNYIGNEERSQGNVKEIFFGPSGDLLTSVNGGGSNTYYGDYHYVKTDNTATEYRSVRFGGSAYPGANAGFVCTASNYGLSYALTSFGSRLCFIPDAT